MKKIIKIEGMMCEHCKKSVTDALEKICGEGKVTVSLEQKNATIETTADNTVLKEAVENIGFDVLGIEEI
ncbi:MAG: heavy-metal-associated domain-containing protein [Clostridiales bacterium]|nr:heavy-metal-associated domain-containing protein [Candidatus Equinaster intestinalis]